MNSFGRLFRTTLWGESHGPQIGLTLDGVPPGLALSPADFRGDLARRAAGAPGTTARREEDEPRIVAGLYEGRTTGGPLTLCFANTDVRTADYAGLAEQPRPSHADRTARLKARGCNDPRGGGASSGRLTVALVAAGVVAKRMLEGVCFHTRLEEVGGVHDTRRFGEVIAKAEAEGDSVGGVIACHIEGAGALLGEPFFDTPESLASHLLFAIPGVKGVWFGDGFEGVRQRGSERNDLLLNGDGATATNHEGGINGGIANGNPIVVHVAVKPTASIAREQRTYDTRTGRPEPLRIGGRHDACIALRAAVVVEAAMAVVLADLQAVERSRR